MIRTYEAGVSVIILLVAMVNFVMLSAGRLGEQWDSTTLDVEAKKALQNLQTIGSTGAFQRFSKIRDPDLLRIPNSESIGFKLYINDEPIDRKTPPKKGEVAVAEAMISYTSMDAAILVPAMHRRLMNSDYVSDVAQKMDYNSIDELADIIIALMWDEDSEDIIEERIRILMDNQNDDGGWGFVGGEESDALSTSMAVRAMSAWINRLGGDPLTNSTVADGISWLKTQVHADGGYGAKERIGSSVEITSSILLAFDEAGLDPSDQWYKEAKDFLLRIQRPDGGFPYTKLTGSQVGPTSAAMEALMAADVPQDVIEAALGYLESDIVSKGNFTLQFTPVGLSGTYDLMLETGYVVDCSPTAYEFWGDSSTNSIVRIADVSGDATNLTILLRIDRNRLLSPDNKQKIALAFSHNITPDTTDWWVLNAGNHHTAGGGKQIDSPLFSSYVEGDYTYLIVTNLNVPSEYNIISDPLGAVKNPDWVMAIVGDVSHPIKDNPGVGYLIGYWDSWAQHLPIADFLAWRTVGSPRVNMVSLFTDGSLDGKFLVDGDKITIDGLEWEVSINYNATGMHLGGLPWNLSLFQEDLNLTSYCIPVEHDFPTLSGSISGLYHMGVISIQDNPMFSRDYRVLLVDSKKKGEYDEVYIWNSTYWNFLPEGSTWNESGNLWVVGVEDDFLTLTNGDPLVMKNLTGTTNTTIIVEGDFLKASVRLHGPKEIWLTLYYDMEEVERALLDGLVTTEFTHVLGSWANFRDTSKAYHALSLAETWLSSQAASDLADDLADLCEQGIKFNKFYNSAVEDKLTLYAWSLAEG